VAHFYADPPPGGQPPPPIVLVTNVSVRRTTVRVAQVAGRFPYGTTDGDFANAGGRRALDPLS
jgi:hypothetical protein